MLRLVLFFLLCSTAFVQAQTINPPSLVQPQNSASNVNVSAFLDWSHVTGNRGYIYEIDITPSFNSSLKRSGPTNLNASSVTVTNLAFGQTYYWRAATKSTSDTSVWSSVRSFTTILAPSLVSPSNNAINIAPSINLDWAAISGSTTYLYELDTTANFNSNIKRIGTSLGSISNVTVNDLLFNQRYYWRIAASNTSDTSAWSTVRTFHTIPNTSLVSPSNFSVNQDVSLLLDWAFVSGNNGYIYEVDTVPSFNSPILINRSFTSNSSQVTVSNLRFGTTYYWRVAVKTISDTSDWSSVFQFTTIDQVTLLSPSNNVTNRDVNLLLDWSFVSGNNGYIYEVDTVPSFNSPVLMNGSFTSNTSQVNVSNLRFGTKYYWRVAAKTTSDTSQWSNVFTFTTTDQVNLISPANNSNNQNLSLTLDWSYISGNNGYIYEVDTVSSFDSPALINGSFSTNSSQVNISNLRFDTRYYWRVAAKTVLDTSDWSLVYSFVTNDGVSLFSPSNNAVNRAVSLTLDWSSVTGNNGYIYQLDTTANFNSPLLLDNSTTNNSSLAAVSNLKYGTTYYWRVAAKSINDTSKWSVIRSFTTSNSPSLNAPPNTFIGTSIRPLIDWGGVSGSTGYIYQLDTSLSFNSPLLIDVIRPGTISQQKTPLLYYGTKYYWRVAAYHTSDTSAWSTIRSFTTFDHVNLSFPVNNASNLTNSPRISWHARFDGTGYIYEVDETPLFNSPSKITGSTTGTSGTAIRADLSGLKYGQDYYWRAAVVSAVDTSGWGTTRKFTTSFLLPNAPNQLSPSNGAFNVQRNSLILDWTDVPNATNYQFQLLTSNNFTATTPVFTVNSSQVFRTQLNIFTTYFWRVRATNNSGNSPWSPIWNFTTEECRSSDTLTVSACDTYTLNNVSYTSTGFYSQLLINSRGCDSTLYLDLNIKNSSSSMLTMSACDSLQINGQTYFNSGNYVQTLINQAGCDSTITLNLNISNSVTNSITVNQCDSFIWNSNGLTYYNSGTYFDTLAANNGCDSVNILNLLIAPSTTNNINVNACDSFAWRGNTYFLSGTYFDTLQSVNNCDSILALNLSLGSSSSSSQTITACNAFNWNGNILSTSGTYFDTIQNNNGCDSLMLLNLTILDSTHQRIKINVCDSITINGQLITQTAVYTQNLTNQNGCDSILTLDVTISNSTSSTLIINSCNQYFWGSTGITYTVSGVYDTTYQSVNGCDSTLQLDLTITSNNTSVQQNGFILTAAQSGATYQWLDCNAGNTAIVGATNRVFIAQQNGTYAVEIQSNSCTDTSACILVNSVGIDEQALDKNDKILIYPNPTDEIVYINLPNQANFAQIELFSNQGKLILKDHFSGDRFKWNLNVSSGLYFIRVTTENGSYTRQVIKK